MIVEYHYFDGVYYTKRYVDLSSDHLEASQQFRNLNLETMGKGNDGYSHIRCVSPQRLNYFNWKTIKTDNMQVLTSDQTLPSAPPTHEGDSSSVEGFPSPLVLEDDEQPGSILSIGHLSTD
jgi:hypothetical protein